MQAFDSNAFGDGAVLGCDFVGEVVKLGSSVSRLANHDIIAGLVWGGTWDGLNPMPWLVLTTSWFYDR